MTLELSRATGLCRSLLMYYGQPWKRRALNRFYAPFVRPGDLAFDIGAHVGSRSRTLLSLGARVVAVEPQSDFANFIERTLRQERLTLLRVAVGPAPGRVELHISSRHPTVTSTSMSWISAVRDTPGFQQVSWDRLERVEVTTLDRMVETYGIPAFCKIDVEGAEAEILQGLHHPLPLIAFEYVPAAMNVAYEAMAQIERLGRYRFNRVVGEQHRFVHGDWMAHDQMVEELSALEASSASGDLYARLDRS